MLCQHCKKRQATIHVTRISGGRRIEQHLCAQCAAELGLTNNDFGLSGFGDMSGMFEFPDLFANFFKRRPADRMYDYFSESAQNILKLAGEEAQRLSNDHLTTEHLLLALIKEEGIAYHVLEALGIKPVDLFSSIETLIGHGMGTPEDISLSPRAKKVLDLAYSSAKELGFNYVGSEHILLGILKESESVAAQALKKRKVTYDKAVKQILATLKNNENEGDMEDEGPDDNEGPSGYAGDEEESPLGGMMGFPGMGIGAPPRQQKPALSSFGRDLTAQAKAGKLDPVIDRDKEIDRVIRILSRRTKNNPALIGDPGVGKTAIVEGLAERIVSGDVPEILKDKKVITLDLAGMVAGTKYRGEFESRIKKVLDEIIAKSRQIILFIDEMHTIVGAGAAEGAIDAANILKPALAKGDLQIIGATTVEEYRKYIEKDPALERRFQPVKVEEPSVDLTILILKGLREKYEAHHGVKIPDAAIEAAAKLSDRYITDRFMPDKAIDLIDEAAAKIRLKLISPPKGLRDAQKELSALKKEKESSLTTQKYEKAATYRDKIKELETKVKKLDDEWKLTRGKIKPVVTEEDIAEIVSDWTGVPVIKLTQAETDKLVHMEETMHKRIIGQDDAVSVISQAIRRGRAGLKAPERPIGSFIFAGPTGVGKTEVARRLAEFMFGSMESMIKLDMSEYMEKHTVSRLIGSPPGYVGYDEGGQLTEAVRRKPYSVILFDEIEKAHPDVFNALLQILEDGHLTDAKGRTVDFKNCVIIMTTNLGSQHLTDGSTPVGFAAKNDNEKSYEKMKNMVLEEIKHEFRPEFLNRVDEIIVFHPLTEEQLEHIIDLLLSDLEKQVEAKEMTLSVNHEVKAYILKKGYDAKFGARPLRRAIQRYIENPLSNEMLKGTFKEHDHIQASMKKGDVAFEKSSSEKKAVEKPKTNASEKKDIPDKPKKKKGST
jgi:ATP-dependent Clp protease ATP-binding subunit ClpC